MRGAHLQSRATKTPEPYLNFRFLTAGHSLIPRAPLSLCISKRGVIFTPGPFCRIYSRIFQLHVDFPDAFRPLGSDVCARVEFATLLSRLPGSLINFEQSWPSCRYFVWSALFLQIRLSLHRSRLVCTPVVA
jgi:hypothetical protein